MLRTATTVCAGAVLSIALSPRLALASSADAESDTLQEVTVTAEKEAENLQKAAAALTAISAEELVNQGVTNLVEAQKIVPSARFQVEANNTQIVVRGVGSVLDFQNVTPSVAFNFAGVFLPREADSAAFFDVAQLEVLPGPQGTLYGRSAIGGTINLTPARPEFNNDGSLLLEAGDYSFIHTTVTQNVKVSDTVALRGAVDYAYSNGFETTGADSKNDASARLSALITPLDRLTAYLWFQAASKDGFDPNLVNKGTSPVTGKYCESCFLFPNNPWNDTRSGAFVEPFGTAVAERNHYVTYMTGGQIDYRFDGATLSYIPSYLYLDSAPAYWLGALLSINTAHYNQTTQELRLASNGDGPFKWLTGLYFYNVRNNGSFTLFANLPFHFLQDDVDGNRLQGYSGFGQVTYSFADTFRAVAGVRFSEDSRTAHGTEPAALGGLPYEFDKSYTNVDWKVGLEKDLLPELMLYGSVSTAYQPGTFNELPNTATFNNEVKPAHLRAYSVGMKSRWFNDRLQINDEIYYYDYRDLLIQSYDISAAYNIIFNAKKVAIKGDQLDILARVFAHDELNMNIGFNHARNVDFITPQGGNFNGYQLAYAPDWTATAGYTHNIPLDAATLRAHIDWRYESSWFGDFVHNPGTEQYASNKGNASLTYDASKWTVGLWVKNMTNRAVIGATAAAGVPGPATSYMEDPRTYGVRLTISY